MKKKHLGYITPEGYERLKVEYDQLWILRRDVTKHLADAAAEGDRSENAEYIYRKKQLREIDRRVRYLQKRLAGLRVVKQIPQDATKIFFGAWAKIENAKGEQLIYRIVGSDEMDMSKGHISIESPMARALLAKSVDQEVKVPLPQGEECLYILEVSYSPIQDI